MPQQAPQPLAAHDLSQAGNRLVLRRWLTGNDQLVAEPLVRPLFVIMVDELSDQMIQVRLAQHHEMIQALDLDRLNPPFHKGIEVG